MKTVSLAVTFVLSTLAPLSANADRVRNSSRRQEEVKPETESRDDTSIEDDELASFTGSYHTSYSSHGPEGLGGTCSGLAYYKELTGADLGVPGVNYMEWDFFYEHTPPHCVLAPIRNYREQLEIQYALNGNNVWLGLYHSPYDIASGAPLTANWFNLDGTPADVLNPGAWASGEPNSPTGPASLRQTRAMMYGNGGNTGKLRDITNDSSVGGGPTLNSAIYKCCYGAISFPNSPGTCQG